MTLKNNILLFISFLISLLPSPYVVSHMCFKSSWIIETPLTFIVSMGSVYYIYCSLQKDRYILPLLAVFIISIVVHFAYLDWLHSSFFPEILLDNSYSIKSFE